MAMRECLPQAASQNSLKKPPELFQVAAKKSSSKGEPISARAAFLVIDMNVDHFIQKQATP